MVVTNTLLPEITRQRNRNTEPLMRQTISRSSHLMNRWSTFSANLTLKKAPTVIPMARSIPDTYSTRSVETNTARDATLSSAVHTTFRALARTKSYRNPPPPVRRSGQSPLRPAQPPRRRLHKTASRTPQWALPETTDPNVVLWRRDLGKHQHDYRDGSHRTEQDRLENLGM